MLFVKVSLSIKILHMIKMVDGVENMDFIFIWWGANCSKMWQKEKKTGFCPKGQVYFLWDIKAKLAGENKARD